MQKSSYNKNHSNHHGIIKKSVIVFVVNIIVVNVIFIIVINYVFLA